MAFTEISFLIILLMILISFYTYRTAFYSPVSKRSKPDDPIPGSQYKAVEEHMHRVSHIMAQYTFEPVMIESYDGLKLYGRFYHWKDGAPVEILFHGYRSHPYRDCGGGHGLARKMGFNALVVDQRAHGKSEGRTICYGIKERKDCLQWVRYCCERFGEEIPIILSGLSMGAATVLMAADLDLPDNVCCVMADSPYSSPAGIIEKVCHDMHYPVALCRPFLHLGALFFGGLRLKESSAVEAVSRSKIPILLIHGEEDHFVPCEMSREIKSACSLAELHTFPGAGHGLSYIIDPKRYEQVVYEFLRKIPALSDAISQEFKDRISQ